MSHGSGWRVNTKGVIRNIRWKAHSAPPSAVIVYGLGELLARGSNGSAPIISSLAKLKNCQVRSFFDALDKITITQIPVSGAEEIGYRELLTAAKFDAQTRQQAAACLNHPPLPRPRLYGLSVIVENFLFSHPQELGRWLAKGQHSVVNQTALAYLAERLIFSFTDKKLHRCMLQTGRPILQAMVAFYLTERWSNAAPLSFGALNMMALEAGLNSIQAFTLAIAAAHETRVKRYSARRRLVESNARLQLLRKKPNKTSDARPHTAGEIDRLPSELTSLSQAKDISEQAVDLLIDQLANAWPNEGLNSSQIKDLSQAMDTDSNEVLVRLAEKFYGISRHQLLDVVINDTANMLGLDASKPALTESFRPNKNDFFLTLEWAAKAFIIRYSDDPKGVGRRTAQHLERLSKATSELLDSPYAATRYSEYASVLTRQICSIFLALEVACNDARRINQTHTALMKLALEQSQLTLQRDRVDMHTDGWADRLATACVILMRYGEVPDLRKNWTMNIRLPSFVRACALWSNVNLIRENPTLAESLFKQAAAHGASYNNDQALSRALTILDIALTASARHNASDVANQLLCLWPIVYGPLRASAGYKWARIHIKLYAALNKEGLTRRRLLDDPQWVNSSSVALIRSNASAK